VPFGEGYHYGAVNGVPFGRNAADYDVQGSTCTDKVGSPVVDSTLTLKHWDKSGITLCNGSTGEEGADTWVRLIDYPIGKYESDAALINSGAPVVYPSSSVMATDVLARSNPSRPDFVPGQIIQDIYEIPKLIRHIGDQLKQGFRVSPNRAANGYLAAKFGWLPLVEDFVKTLDVFKYIDRRNNELDRLFTASGLKRRLRLGKYTGTSESTNFVASGAKGSLTCKQISHTTYEFWGTVRWKPSIAPEFYPNHAQQLALAKRIVLGATASGSFASSWDLIPWTWLLGWCTNVRSFVLAHGNTIPCDHSDVCIMQHGDHHRDMKVTSQSSWMTGGDGTIVRDTKDRFVVSKASISAYPPYLDGGRLLTLGALAVQRFR
jgi:hypothetical protein